MLNCNKSANDISACEYNPDEAIKTNIHGAMNVIDASLAPGGKKVPEGFSYSSDNNTWWLTVEEIRELLKEMK